VTRQRKQSFRSSELAELTRQLIYAPPDKRAAVVPHAEQLHDELETQKNYPIDFVVYRLTERRVPPSENVMLVGEAIKPDLRLLIDALSRSIELACDPSDPGLTTKELAESLGVSTKTVARWRDAGLRWRWGVRGGKPTVLITQSAVDAFQKVNNARVASAKRFSRLAPTEQTLSIERARRLANATDASHQSILAHLARRTARSVESIRLLIQQHDTEHPDQPVFADRTGPLTDEQRQEIDAAYRNGSTVSALCERYSKTRSTIYRAIHEGRASRICSMAIDAVTSPIFERDDADEVLAQPIARSDSARRLGAEAIDALPEKLKSIYDRPIEPDEVVRSLVVRYNFLKYQAFNLQRTICSAPPRASELNQFDELLKKIDDARGEVISAVLPLTLSVARRQLTKPQREGIASLVPMLHTAHRVLFEQIDRYDPAVAHTFESVLTNHLLRSMAKPTKPDKRPDADALIAQLTDAGFSPE
jgi:transposase